MQCINTGCTNEASEEKVRNLAFPDQCWECAQKTEERLQAYRDMKNEFVRVISSEIRR